MRNPTRHCIETFQGTKVGQSNRSNTKADIDASTLNCTGDVPSQKWMNFYTKVLTRFASVRGLRLTVKIEVSPEGGLTQQKVEETKASLRELGLNDQVEVRKTGAA